MAKPWLDTSEADTAQQLGITVAHLRKIRAHNLATKPVVTSQPTVSPLTPEKKAVLDLRGKGSGTIDPTRTATDPNTIAAIQQDGGSSGVAGFNALASVLGPDLAAHVPGVTAPPGAGTKAIGIGHIGPVPIPTGVIGDAAMLAPFGKILRGGGIAVKALHGLGGGTKAVKVAKVAKAVKPYVPREVKLGDESVQFPKSPSKVTAAGQAAYDRASEKLVGPVGTLRGSRSKVAQATGKALTPISARGRVPKQAGKNLRQDARRRQAALAEEGQTVKRVGNSRLPGVHSNGTQLAHFWYAQLPKTHRNVEGLKLVRERLVTEREGYINGSLGAAPPGHLKADVPSRIADITTNIKKLDKVIAKPPPVNEEAISALHALNADREDILTKAGKLTEEDAEGRKGIVTKWLGLHPGAVDPYVSRGVDAVGSLPDRAHQKGYIYHRASIDNLDDIREKGLLPFKPTGSNPTGVYFANEPLQAKGLSWKGGKDVYLRVAKHDVSDLNEDRAWGESFTPSAVPPESLEELGVDGKWHPVASKGEEAYIGHRLHGKSRPPMPVSVSTGRTALPAGLSKPNRTRLISTGRAEQSLQPAINDWASAQRYHLQNVAKDELAKMGEPVTGYLKPGHVIINPKGHKIPRHWKVDQEERAIAEGVDPEHLDIPDLEEYVKNIIGEGPDAQRLIDEAAKHGHLEDLRQVPSDVVKKYYGQFLPAKIHVATPGVQEGAHALAKGADAVNTAIYTSLIYSNPGYVPANLFANLIMAGLHQGAFLPVNLARTGQILVQGSPRLKHLLGAETGMGGTMALTSGKNIVAHAASSLADNAPRISALLHEAGRHGVISSAKPFLTKADFKKLEHWLTSTSSRASLNDASDAAKQAMVDFERLGPMERALAKRLLFVWPWIRGASRYPGRFALDHPVRSAALGYTIAGAPGAPQSVQDDVHAALPNVASGMPPYLAGALEAGNKTIDGHTYPAVLPTRSISPVSTPLEMIQTILDTAGSQKFAGLLNPLIEQAWHLSNRQGSSGFDAGSYGEAAKQAGERLTPDLGLAQDMIHPSAGGIYPGDATRTGRLERASRVMPVAIDPEKAFDARKKAGMVGYQDAATHELIADSKQAGLGQPPANVLDDLRWKTELDHTIKTGASYADRARITAQMFDQRYGGHGAAKQAEAITTEGEAENFYHALRPQLYPTYSEWERQVEYVLDAQMGQQPVSAP